MRDKGESSHKHHGPALWHDSSGAVVWRCFCHDPHTHTHTRNEAAQPCCICSDSCTETPTCTAIHRVQLLTLIAVLHVHAHLDFKLILNFNKKLFLANNCYIVEAIQISLQQPCAVLGTCVLLCSTGLRLGCVCGTAVSNCTWYTWSVGTTSVSQLPPHIQHGCAASFHVCVWLWLQHWQKCRCTTAWLCSHSAGPCPGLSPILVRFQIRFQN